MDNQQIFIAATADYHHANDLQGNGVLIVTHKQQAIERGITLQRNIIGNAIELDYVANLRLGYAVSERRMGEPHRAFPPSIASPFVMLVLSSSRGERNEAAAERRCPVRCPRSAEDGGQVERLAPHRAATGDFGDGQRECFKAI